MTEQKERFFERTDMWREGKWLDLWSVVHFISGVSIGLGFYWLHFDAKAAVVIVLLLLVSYEMWEAMVGIEETPTNRFMDVVVGMAGFLPAFFLLAPRIPDDWFVAAFIAMLAVNVILSIFGWRASQKAAELEKRMRARYMIQRGLLLKRGARLRDRFRE